MTVHKGYSIERVVEMTSQGVDRDDEEIVSYKVELDDKVIAVGLPSEDAAKATIEHRHKVRTRSGLDPVG